MADSDLCQSSPDDVYELAVTVISLLTFTAILDKHVPLRTIS